jgi:hypothetical protein
MTNWAGWFRAQLQSSADGFVWALEQIAPELHDKLPPRPGYLGSWPPIRHIWHFSQYERYLVIPSMRQWLCYPPADGAGWTEGDADDANFARVQQDGLSEVVATFCDIRRQQIVMLDELELVDWEAPQATLWGDKPLKMIVTKTYQHTFEHGDTLLRMGLWWEQFQQEYERRVASGEVSDLP